MIAAKGPESPGSKIEWKKKVNRTHMQTKQGSIQRFIIVNVASTAIFIYFDFSC